MCVRLKPSIHYRQNRHGCNCGRSCCMGRLSRAPPHEGCRRGWTHGIRTGDFFFFFCAVPLAGVLPSPARLLFEHAEDRGVSEITNREWGALLGDRWVTGVL